MVLLIGAFLSPIKAAEIAWQRNLRVAARESGRLGKPLLVEITAEWCGYCHKMEQQTFRDEQIVRHVNHCFVPVTLDADRDPRIVEQMGVEGLPTTVILSPDLKVLAKITGYQTADQFGRHLDRLCRYEEPPVLAQRPVQNPLPAWGRGPGEGERPAHPRPLARASGGEGGFETASQRTQFHPVSQAEQTPAARALPEPPAVEPDFDRYCLVTMLDDRRWVQGSAEFTSTHRGQTVCFATAECKQRFDADPERYWPIADGLCPISTFQEREPRAGEPRQAIIYRKRLWFFADSARNQAFRDNPTAFDALVQ
ncbi:MAG: thioredoxin fold domain-containing protein [Planctomycetaceae bacterium]